MAGNVTHWGVPVNDVYGKNADRLQTSMESLGETVVTWRGEWPPGSPSHDQMHYAFKPFALRAAAERNQVLLWADTSIVPIRPLAPLWDLIEAQGYWFSENLPHGSAGRAWSCGEWTSDEALAQLGITREESFTFAHIIGTAFGLDLRHDIARQFLSEYLRLARGTAFNGAWSNADGKLSSDPRVIGHRHDQTAASVIVWRLGMKLTTPPAWIVDGIPATDATVLEIKRGDS
jgi:hypothetical protein